MRTSLLIPTLALFSTAFAHFDPEQCGPAVGNQRCKDNKCCSQYGWCGTSDDYCLPTRGCNPAFGRCKGASPSSATQPSSTLSGPAGKSTDTCGSNAYGLVCATGYCCSQHGYCGKTSAYCAAGCQSRFGSCLVPVVPKSSSTRTATSTHATSVPSAPSAPISNNGRCGPSFGGQTCHGSSWGSCCSSHNWCGDTKDHCNSGCQPGFGKCSGTRSSSSIRSSTTHTSTTHTSTTQTSTTQTSTTQTSTTQTSTTQTSASPSPSAPVNRILNPRRDLSVDRMSLLNLVPTSPLSLFYREDEPGTYSMLIKASLSSGSKGILLENIAAVGQVTCSETSVTVEFTTDTAAGVARNWPVGTVLFTLFGGCNPADERGVYVLRAPSPVTTLAPIRARAAAQIVTFPVSKSTLKDVVDELDISYGQVVTETNGIQSTTYTTAVTSYYTNTRGTLTSSTFISTITPSWTTMTYTSTSASGSSTTAPSSSTTTSASDTSASSTGTFSLSPSAQAVLRELSAGLPPAGPDGTINVPITKANGAVLPVQPLGPEAYNEDPQYQAALQAALEADHLDPPETLTTDATNALGEEADSNVTPDSPVQLVTSNYAGTDDSVYDSAPPVTVTSNPGAGSKRQVTPARPVSAPNPRAAVSPSDVTAMKERRTLVKRDGWDTFFDIMGNDLVGEICEACGLISAGKDAYDAIKCLMGSCPSPPQVTINTLEGKTTQEFKMEVSLTQGRIFGDAKATVLCVNCYIKVSSLKVEGNVKIIPNQMNYPANFVMSAAFTATQSSVAAMLFNIRVTSAGAGSFDRAISSFKLDSLTAPSVFTISPRFLYGMGLTYDTAQAIDVQAGAVMTLSNAGADIDVKGKTASNPRNWQPSAQVTYPTLKQPGRVALSPYIKTDIQLSLTIFGQYLDNAAVLTTQTNMGFDAEVLTSNQVVTKRNAHLEPRSWFSLIAAIEAARARLQQPPKPTCSAGSMKLNAVMNTKNNAVVGGKVIPLFNQDNRFGSQCIPFAAPPPPPSSTISSTSLTSSRIIPSTTSSSVASSRFPIPSTNSSSVASASPSVASTTSSSVASPSPSAPATCTPPQFGFVPPAGSSCFRIMGHGLPIIEGKYLNKQPGWANPTFQWDNAPPSTFYLDSDGHLYDALQGQVMATDRTDGGAWMAFAGLQSVGSMPKAICTKGASSSLTCFQTTTNVITIGSNFDASDSRRVTPMFGTPARDFQPISLTYEGVACPALCPIPSTTSSLPASTSSSQVASSTTPSASPTSGPQCSNSQTFAVAPAGATCFTITGHGPSHIEGQLLGMAPGYATGSFGYNFIPATLYIGADRFLYVAGEYGNGWVLSTDPQNSPWFAFFPTSYVASQHYVNPTCSLSPQNKAFTCQLGNSITFMVASSKDIYGAADPRGGAPLFGTPVGSSVSMTMTYNEVPCPVRCSSNQPSSTSSAVLTPSSVPSPGSTIRGPSYSSSAVQVSTNGLPTALSIIEATSTGVPVPTNVPSTTSSIIEATSTGSASQVPTSLPPTLSSSTSATPIPSDVAMAPCGGFSPGGTKIISGVAYVVFCGQTGSAPATPIDAVFVPSFNDCMTSCNALSGCYAVMFREIAPNAQGNFQCTRYKALGTPVAGGLDWTGTYDVAVQVS